MKLPSRRAPYLVAAGALSILLGLTGAWSQNARTVKIVVPYPAGGTADILARILGEQISRTEGVTLLTENRPGASAVIGTEAVSRAAPDGSTLLITSTAFLIAPHLRKLNYDPLTSFEPICQLVSTPIIVVVNSESPYRTFADWLNAARAKPGSLTLASIPAGLSRIAFEMLKRAANVDIAFIPYAGDAPAVNALLGGHVTAVFLPYSGVAAQLKAGTLRALATSSRTRIEPLPEVPTVAESGYQGYEVDLWWGIFAPAKTPKGTVSQLAEWFTAALQAPDMKPKLAAAGFYPAGVCGTEFAAYLARQSEEYGRVIREANIKAE
ncbi:MAG TPA: tripartite tricarboxylate transporter substrate binding protein [Xanthobacteraceae bacterium]|nr:tripartite tricarboxylate transporter substrate binding protein [Xanthobacteraceae bacterium]